jgi:uncharacterized protein (DUF983 family)
VTAIRTGSAWVAMLRQRCPRCHQGRVFRTATRMHETCPTCGLVFEREPGYFLGAMYISYGMSVGFLGLGMLACYLLFPSLDLGWDVLIAGAVYLPFVPMVFRYSRVIWMYWDYWAWPEQKFTTETQRTQREHERE